MKIKSVLSFAVASAVSFQLGAVTETLPYQNPELSPEERAADLCGRLTLDEKISLMMNGSPAVDRLGIPAFDWWSEALHGVGRNGLSTVFPSCIGMAASFDDDLIGEIFTAVSDEARAKNTLARQRGNVGKYRCLSFWTPTVNIFRDPRWGRGQESYGEDPYMNGRMGSRVVRALQGDDGRPHRYRKLLACAKHFAVHSGPEKTRHNFDIESLPPRDLWETYLPAFKELITVADAREVMCAYQRFEGQPCCSSDKLLVSILRDEWGFDGLIVSDCGAITDFHGKGRHEVASDAAEASAMAVLAGTDVECGSNYKKLPQAVAQGRISESDIDVSVLRLLTARFELGDFDPDSLVEWTSIPMSVINCERHRRLALEMAREQTVLLANNGVLPLKKDASRIMVMGPNAADSTMMWGIYYGQPGHTVTMLEGIRDKIGDVAYTPACGITSRSERQSIFDLFTAADGSRGMKAEYWNNLDMSGEPVTTVSYTSPIQLDNGGNTAFAPGVELTGFTARARGSFVAERDETLTINFNNDDGFRIIINGDTVHARWKAEPLNFRTRELAVEKGKRYDIEINYMQVDNDATLNFDITRNKDVTVEEIVARTDGYDTVIFFGGISPAFEREQAKVREPGFDDGDRTSIELPQVQRDILAALHRAGKRVVFVNCSGSAVALQPESAVCDAIVQAWYPGEQGGTAVADILFGDYNPSGKLPVTFYTGDSQLPPFDEYRMEGRTYRYLREKPLYYFGHGLSYTDFEIGRPVFHDGKVRVKVTNKGELEGTETVQVYLRRPADKSGPNMTLRAYQRVRLAPGESREIEIDFPRDRFETWDESASAMRVIGGKYELLVGPSADPTRLKSATVKI